MKLSLHFEQRRQNLRVGVEKLQHLFFLVEYTRTACGSTADMPQQQSTRKDDEDDDDDDDDDFRARTTVVSNKQRIGKRNWDTHAHIHTRTATHTRLST